MAGMLFGSPPVLSTRRRPSPTSAPASHGSCPGSFEDAPRAARRCSVDQTGGMVGMCAPDGSVWALPGGFPAVEVASRRGRGPTGGPGLLSMELGCGGDVAAPAKGDERGQVSGAPGGAAARRVRPPWELSRLQEEHAVFSSDLVVAAYHLAGCAHQGQWRKSGDPVLSHCAETARILAQLNADETTVAAALLHDVLDDTSTPKDLIESRVGGDVLDLVRKVGNVSRLSQLVRDSAHDLAEEDYSRLRDMLVAISDARVVLIKLADRLHNMRTLGALRANKQARVADETLRVFAPLAERLNAWSLKSELEDLAFGVLEPDRKAALRAEYEGIMESRRDSDLGGALERLKAGLEGEGVVWEDISGRRKSLYGVARKMERKGYESMSEVPDLLALRVVVRSKVDCYAVLRKVHQLWRAVPGRLKDYIRNPKANGYQSIHEDVQAPDGSTFEVQIRTDKMHYIAEHGLAAHWRYKEAGEAGSVSEFVAARTLWSQYVLGWVLEVNDKKLRPSGCATEGSIWKTCTTFADDRGSRMDGRLGCRHHAQPPPRPVTEHDFWEPLYVAVSGPKGLDVCQLSRGCTLGQYMLTRVGMDWPTRGLPTVNGQLVSTGYALRFGDVLEFPDESQGLDVYSMSGFANLDLDKAPGGLESMGERDAPQEVALG